MPGHAAGCSAIGLGLWPADNLAILALADKFIRHPKVGQHSIVTDHSISISHQQVAFSPNLTPVSHFLYAMNRLSSTGVLQLHITSRIEY